MTKDEALAKLDRLDEYWSQERIVDQLKGVIFKSKLGLGECGCFGAHCAVALGRTKLYAAAYRQIPAYAHTWGIGADEMHEIAIGLGIGSQNLMSVLREFSRRNVPFGIEEWHEHPNLAWPKISEKLRRLAQ